MGGTGPLFQRSAIRRLRLELGLALRLVGLGLVGLQLVKLGLGSVGFGLADLQNSRPQSLWSEPDQTGVTP